MDNPYATPESQVVDKSAPKKAKSPKVIAIILLIIAPISLLGMGVTLYLAQTGFGNIKQTWEAMGLSMPYIYFTHVVGILVLLWLLYIAVKLLKYKDKGRVHYNYYFIYLLVSSILTGIYQFSVLPEGQGLMNIGSTLFGMLISFALVFLGRYYLNKPTTRAWLT